MRRRGPSAPALPGVWNWHTTDGAVTAAPGALLAYRTTGAGRPRCRRVLACGPRTPMTSWHGPTQAVGRRAARCGVRGWRRHHAGHPASTGCAGRPRQATNQPAGRSPAPHAGSSVSDLMSVIAGATTQQPDDFGVRTARPRWRGSRRGRTGPVRPAASRNSP
jgi:hypothetical protein